MVQGIITPTTRRTISVLEEFRKLDPEMQAQTVLTFLYVMDTPGISMTELSERVGYSQASTSRNVAALSEHQRLGKAGAGLLDAREDPANRRSWSTSPDAGRFSPGS
jgi:DNA-binding MarR family transcriptional regulator